MRKFISICMWFVSFYILALIAMAIYPEDEATSTITVSLWFALIWVFVPFVVARTIWKGGKRKRRGFPFAKSCKASDDCEGGTPSPASGDLTPDDFEPNVLISSANSIDFDLILKEEENWRRSQAGLSPVECELQKIDAMSGHDFEYWCADLLKRTGFENVKVTQGSGDQGVDVLAEKDGIKYAVQCKCYSSDLGNTPVQEVNLGKTIYHCHVGVVMTNRHFTPGAKTAAEASSTLLWDRDTIVKMLEEVNT